MFHKIRMLQVSAFAVGLLATGACIADTASGTTPIPGYEVTPENSLASVNGRPVNRFARDAVVRQLRTNGQDVDEAQILEELINLELLAQKAVAIDLQKSDEIAAILQLQYNQTLAQNYMAELSKDIEITEDDIRAEYDVQTANMSVDEYRASHILLDEEQDAIDVIKDLEGGDDFAELAKGRSTGPTGPSGGDLGWFQISSMVPEFASALQELSVGEITDEPVKSDFGWHVITLADKRSTNKPQYDEIKDDLRDIIMRDRLSSLIDQMRTQADITIKPE